MKALYIYGSGGFGREVAWLAEETRQYDVLGFIDDNETQQGKILNNIPVLSLDIAYAQNPDARIVSGIGSPQLRERLMAKANEKGFGFAVLIHPSVSMSKWVSIDDGTVICAKNAITTNITFGKHVQINLDCTVGHDAILEEYTTLAPGVHVSGWVHLGKRVYIGTGANIINGTETTPLYIADDVVVGAGACVTKSITEAGITVVGTPARPLKK